MHGLLFTMAEKFVLIIIPSIDFILVDLKFLVRNFYELCHVSKIRKASLLLMTEQSVSVFTDMALSGDAL